MVFRADPEASLDAVAGQAGLSRRSIYGHFASRDELLAELLVRGGARISAALAGVHDPDPRIHLALVGAALWTEVQQVRVLAQLAIHGPLEKTVADALAPVRASVRTAVAGGVAAGHFRTDVPEPSLARLIEDAAIAVLDEAVRSELSEAEARRLVMAVGLSVAGLSWQDAAAVIDALPSDPTTQAGADRVDGSGVVGVLGQSRPHDPPQRPTNDTEPDTNTDTDRDPR